MIIKTLVAVKSKGQDVGRWLNYLEKKSREKSHQCLYPAFYEKNGYTPIYLADLPDYKVSAPSHSTLLSLAEQTGVVRQIIIAPLIKRNWFKQLELAREVIEKFKFHTGKMNLIPIYAPHMDTQFHHIHVLLFSPHSSELYINHDQLVLLKYIAAEIFREPIGKNAYMKYMESEIESAPDEKMRTLYKERAKIIAKVHPLLNKVINEEVNEMNEMDL